MLIYGVSYHQCLLNKCQEESSETFIKNIKNLLDFDGAQHVRCQWRQVLGVRCWHRAVRVGVDARVQVARELLAAFQRWVIAI
jgi:hypothetical protein